MFHSHHGRGRASGRLRALLCKGKVLFVPGCYNAVSSRVLDGVGFPAIYMSGYGTSLALLGMPDSGLATMSEMLLNARYIANAVSAPVIADADNGYGNAINVMRCVREYIQSGVAGIHIEDQVAPKRCGHVAGREVIPLVEAIGRIRAADAARRELDPDFDLIARTDARGGHTEARSTRPFGARTRISRLARTWRSSRAPTSEEEVEQICKEVRGKLFYNMTGVSPRMNLDRMQELGIAIAITAWVTLRATLRAVYDIAVKLRDEGPLADAAFMESMKQHPMGDLHSFAGFDKIRAWEEEYLLAEDLAKYSDSIGQLPSASSTGA